MARLWPVVVAWGMMGLGGWRHRRAGIEWTLVLALAGGLVVYPVGHAILRGHVPLVALWRIVVLCHGGDSQKVEVQAGGIYVVWREA